MYRILFVCTGNTCRSPMAEALLRNTLEERGMHGYEVRSAGVAAPEGSPASKGAQVALDSRQISADKHRSKMFTQEIGQWADLILTMTASHKMLLGSRFPQFLDKTFTLKEYIGAEGGVDIADPFGGSQDIYEESAQEIQQAVNQLVELLKQE